MMFLMVIFVAMVTIFMVTRKPQQRKYLKHTNNKKILTKITI